MPDGGRLGGRFGQRRPWATCHSRSALFTSLRLVFQASIIHTRGGDSPPSSSFNDMHDIYFRAMLATLYHTYLPESDFPIARSPSNGDSAFPLKSLQSGDRDWHKLGRTHRADPSQEPFFSLFHHRENPKLCSRGSFMQPEGLGQNFIIKAWLKLKGE